MSEADGRWLAWLDEFRANVARFRLVFLHLGAAQSGTRARLLHVFAAEAVDASEFVENTTAVYGTSIVIDQLELIVNTDSFGPLRERVLALLDLGTTVALVSRIPKIAFESSPGSSLLLDARFVHGPVSPGTRSIDQRAVWLDLEDGEWSLDLIFQNALSELGSAVNASLDQALFESMFPAQDALAALDAREVEALVGASLVWIDSGKPRWVLPTRSLTLKSALSEVIARQVGMDTGAGQIYGVLWHLERSLRLAIRHRAVETWGSKWRQSSLTQALAEKVLERATESAYSAAKSVKEIRDPFEWLTLGELLEVRSRPEIGDLGLEERLWRIFASELLPVRNRLMHMRASRPTDLGLARRWDVALTRKLNVTGVLAARAATPQ